MFPVRGRRYLTLALVIVGIVFLVIVTDGPNGRAHGYFRHYLHRTGDPNAPPKPNYIPEPAWVPPPIKDPFPSLATTAPPPIPPWNVPKTDLYKTYGLDYAPPLFIGFTRTWPVLLQAVVSYITAGWPAESIYVVENTGVQRSNANGRLTLQNPFFLDYTVLSKLGVKIIQTPVLMNFAQLQNFYLHLSHEREWPYYFWSHMDVLALSFEAGEDGVTPRAGEDGYKTIYELCLAELGRVRKSDERWADKFFAYDHLTLVNRAAYDDIGGWDTFIPYYMTDCDMHSRLMMSGYTQLDARAGIVTDVSAALDDLLALYRVETIEPTFTDPNPAPPRKDKAKRAELGAEGAVEPREAKDGEAKTQPESTSLAYWHKLRHAADEMFVYKHGDRGRNTWQVGQHGGQGEPYYYAARGIAEGIDVMTEAGREVFRRKWGHQECDIITGAGLKLDDQWMVEKDW